MCFSNLVNLSPVRQVQTGPVVEDLNTSDQKSNVASKNCVSQVTFQNLKFLTIFIKVKFHIGSRIEKALEGDNYIFLIVAF